MANFTDRDLKLIEARGLTLQEAERQLALLRQASSFRALDRPCTPGDGVLRLDNDRLAHYEDLGRRVSGQGRVARFVPASGAASRMFKVLAQYKSRRGLKRKGLKDKSMAEFFDRLADFAFSAELAAELAKKNYDLDGLLKGENLELILETLLDEDGMGYADKPKALLKFHRGRGGALSALAEQLAEASACHRADNGDVRVHFTVTPQHQAALEAEVAEALKTVEGKFEVSYSSQAPSTDTLSLDEKGEVFHRPDGSLLFRPGGHGALLKNLHDFQGDLVQVKNIDNIAPESGRALQVTFKRALTGLLAELQNRAHAITANLAANPDDELVRAEARRFLAEALFINDVPDRGAALLDLLDRPIRVAGVVKNQGEPGGGPFWVKDSKGWVSAQIVETAEIDVNDARQAAMLDEATHFNPVDMVLALRDGEGRPYDLFKFKDDSAVFRSKKSLEGRPLTALELPGLWNGSMAGWLTIFVEVPLETSILSRL